MDGKFLIVRFTTHLHHQIRWQREVTTLQIFLQTRFRIFLFIARTDFIQTGLIPIQDQFFYGLDIAVQRNTPPINASTVSARIDSRRKPPLFSSPGPRRRHSPIQIRVRFRKGCYPLPAWRACGSYHLHPHAETMIKRISNHETQNRVT